MEAQKKTNVQHHKVYEGKIAGCYDLESQTLGSGHFAVVKVARHCFTGEKVAVKVIDKTKLDEVSKAHLFQEVRCMKLVQHPNVVRLYEAIDTQTKLYLILELGDGGDLYDFIMRHEEGLTENLARIYFRQIVRAISYCHELHVVHRDLKPENVIFFKNKEIVKLTDFGFSNKFLPGQKLATSCGSLAYSAPEILIGDRYDAAAVDIWSLGVILYHLVYGHPPFHEANDSETLTMIMDCKYELPDHVSLECRNLIKSMLIKDPEARSSLENIANHPWMQDMSTDDKQHVDYLPLINRHQVSDENHASIIQKMIHGNIAKKEEILEALDRNEYNHITATYFLLAERKLRQQQQIQQQAAQKLNPKKKPDLSLQLVSPTSTSIQNKYFNTNSSSLLQPPSIHSPRTPGDMQRRHRKCSIVKEEDGDEDHHDCESSSLNRRGSRSEGRINLSVQEVLSSDISGKLKIDKNFRRPEKFVDGGKLEMKTKLLDGISNVKLIGKNENEKFLGHAGMGVRKMPGTFQKQPLFNKKLASLEPNTSDEFGQNSPGIKNDNLASSTYCDNNSERKKPNNNSSTDDEDETEDKKKPFKPSFSLNNKYSKQRRDSHDDSSDSQEPASGTSNRILINIDKCSSSTAKHSSNGGRDGKKSGSVKDSNEGDYFEESNDNSTSHAAVGDCQQLNRDCGLTDSALFTDSSVTSSSKLTSRSSKSNKNNSNGKVKKNSSRFLGFLRESSESRDYNYKSNRKSFSDAEFLKVRNEKSEKELCPSENIQNRKLVGRYLEVTKKICQPISDLFRNSSHQSNSNLYKASSCNSILRDSIFEPSGKQHLREQKICD